MPQPLIQTIRSKYDDADVKKYIRDLERIKKLEKETGRGRPGRRPGRQPGGGGGPLVPPKTNAAKRAVKELRQTMAELRIEYNRLDLANRRGELSNEEFASAVEKMRRRTERALQGVTSEFKELPREVKIALGRAENSLDRFSTRAREVATGQTRLRTRIGQGVRDAVGLGRGAVLGGIIALTMGVRRLGHAVVGTGKGFEQTMSRVRALSKSTDEQFRRQTDTARTLGETTVFSATQAAQGMALLAQAGLSVDEQIAALPGTLDLAAAGQLGLADATDIAAKVLRGFNLDASETGRVSDVLAATSTRSNTTVHSLGETMKFVAPIAAGLGIDLEEVAAAAGILGDAGLTGERGGTALRALLVRLVKPTRDVSQGLKAAGVEVTDTSGRMRSLTDIIRDLDEGTRGMTATQRNMILAQVAGTRAVSGLLALVNRGPDELAHFRAGLDAAGGSAKQLADEQLNNLSGDLRLLKSAAEEFSLILFDKVKGGLRASAQAVTGFLTGLNALTKSVGKLEAQYKTAMDELGRLDDLDKALRTYTSLKDETNLTTEQTAIFEKAVDDLQRAFPGLVTNTDDAGRAIGFYTNRVREAIAAQRDFQLALQQSAIQDLADQYVDYTEKAESARKKQKELNDLMDRGMTRPGRMSRVQLSVEARFMDEELTQAGESAQTFEEIARRSVSALVGLFQTADGIDLDGLTRALVGPNRSMAEAATLTDELAEAWQRLQGVAGRAEPATPFSSAFSAAFSPLAGIDLTVPTASLSAQIKALKEQKAALVDAGVAGEELLRINRQLNALIKQRDRLESFGLPGPDAQKQTKALFEEITNLVTAVQTASIENDHFRESFIRLGEVQENIKTLQDGLAKTDLSFTDAQRAEIEATIQTLQDEEEQLKKQLRTYQDIAAAAEKIRTNLIKNDGLTPRGLDLGPELFAPGTEDMLTRLGSLTEQFHKRVNDLKTQRALGQITEDAFDEEVTAAADAFLLRLKAMAEIWQLLGLITPQVAEEIARVFDELDGAKKAEKTTEKISQNLQEMASALDGLRGLLGVFGALDESLDGLLRGTADVLDNLDRLRQFRGTFDTEGGPDAGSAAAIFGQITPLLGIATGVAGFVSSLIGDSGKTREELRALQKALRENARDIARSIRDFTRSARPGATITGEEARQAGAVPEQLDAFRQRQRQDYEAFLRDTAEEQQGPASSEARRRFQEEQERDLKAFFLGQLQDLEDLDLEGLDVEALRTLFEQALQSGLSVSEAIEAIFQGTLPGMEQGLQGFLDAIADGADAFGKSVDGAVTAMDFFQRFMEQDFPTAFKGFLDFLLKNVDGLSDEAKALLNEALDLDLSKEEDRERAKQIGQAFVQAIIARDLDFLGSLSPEDAEKIAEIFLEASGEAFGDGAGSETAALQVQRVISDTQGNQVIRSLEVIAHWTRRTAEILDARLVKGLPGSPSFDKGFGGAGPSLIETPTLPPLPPIFYEQRPPISGQTLARLSQGSANTTTAHFGDVHLDVPFDPSDPEFARACGQALEEHIRRRQAGF